jgi:hypothetical protein
MATTTDNGNGSFTLSDGETESEVRFVAGDIEGRARLQKKLDSGEWAPFYEVFQISAGRLAARDLNVGGSPEEFLLDGDQHVTHP